MTVSQQTLMQKQSLDLNAKIIMSKKRIREWYDHYDGEVYVAFSGGLDSTVLLHLVRSLYPDMPAVFTDTGLEYPENREFVKRTPNVTWLRPANTFKQVIDRWGYPVVSKIVAGHIQHVRGAGEGNTAAKRLRLKGIMKSGGFSPASMIALKWQRLIYAPFKISNYCCDVLKKNPAHAYDKKTGQCPFLGMRATESELRTMQYVRQGGCNAYSQERPTSWPLSFWKDQDIREYLRKMNVEYSPLYDMGYERSGCMFCMFGVHLDRTPNRFQQMAKTHPKQYDYCMNKLGLARVLGYLHVPYRPRFRFF